MSRHPGGLALRSFIFPYSIRSARDRIGFVVGEFSSVLAGGGRALSGQGGLGVLSRKFGPARVISTRRTWPPNLSTRLTGYAKGAWFCSIGQQFGRCVCGGGGERGGFGGGCDRIFIGVDASFG